jgi:hypothetical protein
VKVLFAVIDGASPRHVDPTVMPTLHGLARNGAWCRAGAIGVLPTSTYPNHATFVTGESPAVHGIVANEWPSPLGTVSSWDVGPSVPTIFDSMRAAGRPSAAVFGDDHLVGVTGAGRADVLWPEGGFDADVTRDVLGYATDGETVGRVTQAVEQGCELVVAQLNETDTVAHIFGPDSDQALEHYRKVDGLLSRLVDSLRHEWGEWAVVVVSDHSQETVTVAEPIDLRAEAAARHLLGDVIDDGSTAVIGGELAVDAGWTTEVTGVEGFHRVDADTVLVWARAGRWFSPIALPVHGVHGSPRTSAQVAVVGGGHPKAEQFRTVLAEGRPRSTMWAPAVAELLGVVAPADLDRTDWAPPEPG